MVLVLHLWYYLTGYVRLRVAGMSLEKFINLCISRGIYLWDIRREAESIVVSTGASNFRLLRPIARSSCCRVKILQKRGLPFHLYRLRGRKILAAGGLLFFALLYFLSSFIWSVEITGIVDPVQVKQILTEAENRGARPGVYKGKIDTDELARQIILQLPGLAWVQVSIQGTRLVIDAVPKENSPKVGLPCHLVARQAGVVQEITVLVGEPQVREGQIVERGEVLIRGILGDRPVAAQGIVWGTVWYEAYGQWPRREIIRSRTGNTYRVIILRLGKYDFRFQVEEIPFQKYEEEAEIKRIRPWRNFILPVEAIVKTYYEVEEEVQILSVAEAEARARALALAKIKSRLTRDARVLREEVRRVPLGRVDQVQVKVILEVLENIAEARGFDPEAFETERGQQVETEEGSQVNRTDQ